MFGTTKPTASLSSGLLARKGQARPAMRPQGFHGQDFSQGTMNLDDLGWNDMGDEPAPPNAAVVSIAAAAAPIAPPVAIVPPVLVERETLREEIEVAPEPVEATIEETAPVAPPPVPAAAAARIQHEVNSAKSKAAFTLRLDADRHLRLRLASASRNRSAQALVVDALDAFLSSLPEVDGLVSQLSTTKTSKGEMKS